MKLHSMFYVAGIGCIACTGAYLVGKRIADYVFVAQYPMAVVGVGLILMIVGAALNMASWFIEMMDDGL